MKAPLLAVLAATFALSGCTTVRESRLNPLNWFGSSQPEAVTLAPEGGYATPVQDFRQPALQITELALRPVSGGAIVVATGTAPTQGWWDAELVSDTDDKPVDGVLKFRLLMAQPNPGDPAGSRSGTPQSREITVSKFLPNQRVAVLRKVVVEGQGNARSVSR